MSGTSEYEGIWFYDPIGTEKIDEIKRISKAYGLYHLAGLSPEELITGLDFGYAGRDSGRRVEEFLQKIARLIGDASGDIRCQIYDDAQEDPYFEYYTVKDGVLYRQRGDIVRREPERV